MRSFNDSFNTERAKRGTSPINLVDFGFTSPVLVSDRDMIIPVLSESPLEQDFTEFVEVDSSGQILNIQSDSVQFAYLGVAGGQSYLYMDMGEGHFGRTDFVHQSSFQVAGDSASYNSFVCVWGLADGLGNILSQAARMDITVSKAGPTVAAIVLSAHGDGWTVNDYNTSLSLDTFYYLTTTYNAGIRVLTCAIYSDSARTALVDTLSVTLNAALSMRYLYALTTANTLHPLSGSIGSLTIDSSCVNVSGLVTDWSYVDSATDTARDLVSPVTAPDLELTLANTGGTPFSSLFDSEPVESVPVTLTQYFDGLSWDYAEVIFRGYVREVTEYNSLTCTLLIQGLWAKYDRLIGRDLAITRNAFPNADPDAMGKMQPLVYGTVDNLPCLAVKAGAMSNLPGDITASVTSIELSDASVFPTSGTVQIDTEQITYAGKSSNTLTGCTRGRNSTTAINHDAGASVAQVLTQYVYLLAGHPVKSIGNVYVDGIRQTSGVTKYTGQTGSVLTGYTGKAVIAFDALPVISKQVNIEAEVDEGSHTHTATGSSTVAIPGTNYSNIGGDWHDPAYAKDGNESTYAYALMDEGERLGLQFSRSSLGAVSSLRVKIVYSSDLPTSETNFLYVQIDTSSKQYLPGTGGVDNKATVYRTFNRNDWGFWVYIDTEDLFVPRNCRIYEVSVVATYGIGVLAGPAEGIMVSLSGNSSADTVIGGQVTADLQGFQDDASGTYTGAANALIERPDHVFKHLLMARLGMSSDLLDASAFTAAGTSYNVSCQG